VRVLRGEVGVDVVGDGRKRRKHDVVDVLSIHSAIFRRLMREAKKHANGDCYRIQTWALEEARRRLEVEGILKEPEDKP
jgi:histone H3/H4